jgi:hypothetical protein
MLRLLAKTDGEDQRRLGVPELTIITRHHDSFIDLYSSANPDNPAFVGNRSIVIHDAGMNRVGCASFERVPLAADATCVEFTPL